MPAVIPLRPAAQAPEAIEARLRAGGRTLVALSGGVDSAVVAYLAHRALGADALAVTLVGSAVSAEERRAAAASARAIGIEAHVLDADPIELAEYRENPEDRCYYCRKVETRALRSFGDPRGVRQYVDGVHADDLGGDRPGLRAMAEAGFLHPLLDAGWGKREVRAFAREAGLPSWERPSNACLASRVAHGERISAALLGRIDRAETLLREIGFRQVRVRVRAGVGHVEVGPSEVAQLFEPATAARVTAELRVQGFERVVLDRDGYHGRRES